MIEGVHEMILFGRRNDTTTSHKKTSQHRVTLLVSLTVPRTRRWIKTSRIYYCLFNWADVSNSRSTEVSRTVLIFIDSGHNSEKCALSPE